MRLSSCLLFLLCYCLTAPVLAQDGLQSPADFLGYELGEQFTPHHRVVDYVEHVAAQSGNVSVEPYGETYEGRPLMLAYIAAPEQIARLEEIRKDNLQRTGLLEGEASADGLSIVWLSYNVHGNESVSTEAAMATLYDLANPANTRTQAWLQNTVVILDPCINPDGRERYVQWYKRSVGRTYNADPDAREHHEPWPGGRTNHYYFDLNRDWAWATQQETQQRLVVYNRWMPHVHVDFHEQGVDSPYYFAPAAEPFHEAITGWQRAFQTTIGLNHTRYFDREGWLYFTRQVFDLFYPAYGDTWPTFNGAIGMTYEQGGSGRAGLGIRTAIGDTLTLADRIAHHHTTGLSTVEATSENRARVVQEFAAYFDAAQEGAGLYTAYVMKHGDAPGKLTALAALLDQQDIRYGYATGASTTRGRSYADGGTGRATIAAGDLIVPAAQPKGVLANVLFEPEASLADSLSYDITAWALPYAYGIEAFALTEAANYGALAPTPPAPATPPSVARPYAYLADWQSFEDVQFLAALLQRGIVARVAMQPFEIGGRAYNAGTLVLTRTNNQHLANQGDEGFDAAVREIAAATGQTLYPVATGFVTSGADFGSSDVAYVKAPRVAVLSGAKVSSYALGEIWHYFDQQLGYPITLIDTDDFGGITLSDYDVLILPSGRYDDMLPESRLNELKGWIREGGRLLAIQGGAGFFAGKDGFNLKRKPDAAAGKEGTKESKEDTTTASLRTYAERDREAISSDVSGAIFRVQLDNTHPLAFGYADTYFTLKRGDDDYAFLEDDWNVGVIRENARMSGFAGIKAQRKLENTLVFGVQPMGRGKVIYMLDDPLFRGFWYAGRLLFGNAVFLSK